MTSRTWLTRAGVALLSSTAAVSVFSAPAQAATTGLVAVNDGKLTFVAGSGKTNRLWLVESKGQIVVDDKVAVKAGRGCTPVPGDNTRVTCSGVTSATVSLGSGNDVFVNRTKVLVRVYGGAGNDTLNGGFTRDIIRGGAGNDKINANDGNDTVYGDSGNDVIYGGQGNDAIYDGAGNDRVYGDSGNDTLVDGAGRDTIAGNAGNDIIVAGASFHADRYLGGSGIDTVNYLSFTKAIKASPDGKANDGRNGEKDNIATDVENLVGGRGSDILHGTAVANVLEGGPGNDKLYGNGGADTLYGGAGKDYLAGGAGNDRLIGDPGVNHDTGKLFADLLLGGSGVDTADYRSYHEPVTVNLDGKANDGVKGEKDIVGADVENITGGYGSDRLTGNNANNVLDGGGEGADVLTGLGGDDTLLSDNDPAVFDEQVDRLDGGTHVNGDTCGYDAEDIAVNCELS